jgi:hypothetical protein
MRYLEPTTQSEAAPSNRAGARRAGRQWLFLLLGLLVGSLGVAAFTVLPRGGATAALPGPSGVIAPGGAASATSVAAPTTTTGPPSTTTTLRPRPEDTFAEAQASWQQVSAGMDYSAGPDRVNGVPVAVGASGTQVNVWNWDGMRWSVGPSLFYNQGEEPVGLYALAMGDVTGDASAEIVVTYVPGNDNVGEVFYLSPQGEWRSAPFDQSPVGFGSSLPETPTVEDGELTSLTSTCWPSCGDGSTLRIAFHWDGTGFVATSASCETFRRPDYLVGLGICDSDEQVEVVQEALIYFGYLRGDADGNYGPATRAAVARYQRDRGDYQTGNLTNDDIWDLLDEYNYAFYGEVLGD